MKCVCVRYFKGKYLLLFQAKDIGMKSLTFKKRTIVFENPGYKEKGGIVQLLKK